MLYIHLYPFQKLTLNFYNDIRYKEKSVKIKTDENNNIGFPARIHRNYGHPRRDAQHGLPDLENGFWR